MRTWIACFVLFQLYLFNIQASLHAHIVQDAEGYKSLATISATVSPAIFPSPTLSRRSNDLYLPVDSVRRSNSLNIKVSDAVSDGMIFVFARDPKRVGNHYLIGARFLMNGRKPLSKKPIQDLKAKCTDLAVSEVIIVLPHACVSSFGPKLSKYLQLSLKPSKAPEVISYAQPRGLEESAHVKWTFLMDFGTRKLSATERLVNLNDLDEYVKPDLPFNEALSRLYQYSPPRSGTSDAALFPTGFPQIRR